MKIGISVQGMIGQRVDGGRRYAIELLKYLVPLINKNKHQSIIFCSNGDEQILNGLRLESSVVSVAMPGNLPFILRGLRWGLRHMKLWQEKNLDWYAKKSQVDFIHFFGYPDFNYTGNYMVTLHCLQHEYFPEFFENVKERKELYKKMLTGARLIVTNSNYTAKSAMERFGTNLNNKHIFPIHLGGGEEKLNRAVSWNNIRNKYSINKPFIVYPASNMISKNHQRLLEAFSKIVHDDKKDIVLILTGFETYPKIKWDIEQLNLNNNVIILGKVSDDELNVIVKNALCMPFVSLFEGFGLPVVEAMSLGTPVICSKSCSLPEIAGDAALFVNPLSVKDIYSKLKIVLEDEALRIRLGEMGEKQSQLFTWQQCALETYKAYTEMEQIIKNENMHCSK